MGGWGCGVWVGGGNVVLVPVSVKVDQSICLPRHSQSTRLPHTSLSHATGLKAGTGYTGTRNHSTSKIYLESIEF